MTTQHLFVNAILLHLCHFRKIRQLHLTTLFHTSPTAGYKFPAHTALAQAVPVASDPVLDLYLSVCGNLSTHDNCTRAVHTQWPVLPESAVQPQPHTDGHRTTNNGSADLRACVQQIIAHAILMHIPSKGPANTHQRPCSAADAITAACREQPTQLSPPRAFEDCALNAPTQRGLQLLST